jgi:ferredoxin--NADP+ reductase
MPNARGRVLDEQGAPIPGLYCAGWIKRGPTGVIGTNKKDATETVDSLLEDAHAGLLSRSSNADARIDELLAERGVDVVMYEGWESIDTLERDRGTGQGRPRVKLCTWDELLEAARG